MFTGRLPLVFFTNMPTNASLVQNSVTFKTQYDLSLIHISMCIRDRGMTYEGYGPHGVAVFVDTLTDNTTRTAVSYTHLISV